jgi:hypothetical protein
MTRVGPVNGVRLVCSWILWGTYWAAGQEMSKTQEDGNRDICFYGEDSDRCQGKSEDPSLPVG